MYSEASDIPAAQHYMVRHFHKTREEVAATVIAFEPQHHVELDRSIPACSEPVVPFHHPIWECRTDKVFMHTGVYLNMKNGVYFNDPALR